MFDPEGFWSRSTETPSGCREWQGSTTQRGYGQLGIQGRVRSAHRVAYWLAYGEPEPGMFVVQTCENKVCVHPPHLEAITPREKNLRSVARGTHRETQKTSCPQGHALKAPNLVVSHLPRRKCLSCHRANQWTAFPEAYQLASDAKFVEIMGE